MSYPPSAERSFEETEALTLPTGRHLWAAVLAKLVQDAQAGWLGAGAAGGFHGGHEYLVGAHVDVYQCGPMTRHVCGFAETNPEWLSARYRRWCAATPPGTEAPHTAFDGSQPAS